MTRKVLLPALLLIALQDIGAGHASLPATAAGQAEADFNRGGVTLHYRALGSGPPLLLLSGGPGFTVDPLISTASELAPSHKCILFDQRGTGKSTVRVLDGTTINLKAYIDDLEALRRQLRVKTWTILGLSWGGMLGMAYAAAHPAAVHALVLVDSGGINQDFWKDFRANLNNRLLPSEREAAAYWADPSRIAADPDRAGYESLRAVLPGYFYDRKKSAAVIESLTPKSFNIKVSLLMRADLEKQKYDLRGALKSFRRPVLLVYGKQDPIGEQTAYEIHQTLSNSRLEFIDECGHMPMIEQPDAYFRIVKRFLQEHR